MSLAYAVPEDVARLLDDPPDQITSGRRQEYRARLERASQKWDRTTGRPMRTVRVGSQARTETWEYHDVREARGGPPVTIDINYGSILPIDRDAGDRVEIRKGRDSWDDVTDEEGDTWTLNYRSGELKAYRFLISRAFFEAPHERFLRLTYRHGGLGGDRNLGAETALTSSVTDTETTLPVGEAAAFPRAPFTVLLGDGVDSPEYATVTAVNSDADELTVERGQESTSPVAWDADTTVQYSPADVREAVASKATEQLIMNDDADLSVPDNGNLSSRAERAERLRDEWEETCGKYAGVRTL